jgi:isoleucyl-tRNA synthetase
LTLPPGSAQQPAFDWDAVLHVRSAVARELEKLRNSGAIGAPLDAEIDLYCEPALFDTLNAFGEELRFVFITSGARVHAADERPPEAVAADSGPTTWIVVKPSAATKCVRCWHKQPDVGSHADHPQLCGRCVSNVQGPGEARRYV